MRGLCSNMRAQTPHPAPRIKSGGRATLEFKPDGRLFSPWEKEVGPLTARAV